MTRLQPGDTVDYTVTYLEMTERPTYPRPHLPAGHPAALLKAEAPPAWYFLSLYDAVGRDYLWEDMHEESEEDLAAWLADTDTSLFTLMQDGWPHGFFLLDHRTPSICDLAYFGLVPQAVGRGYGRYLLESAVHTGWDLPGVEKMTVNTNTLDHPRALGLYQRVGFAPVRRVDTSRTVTRPVDRGQIPD